MSRENFTNFATSTISGALTSGSTSITVVSGSNFATSNFTVTIDTEVIFISSRSGNTLTVGTRGYDGTTAASHSSGATIQSCVSSYNFNHLWSNVADTYYPDIPPTQTPLSSGGVPTGTASASDKEFETSTGWTLTPGAGSGGVFAINSSLRSHLLFMRGTNDNTLYSAYMSFTQTGAWTATCKLSTGINVPLNGSQTVETHFFVSDQSNPTAGADTGNRFRMDVVSSSSRTGSMIDSTAHFVRSSKDVSGAWTGLVPSIPVSPAMPLYLRITTDGSGVWKGYVGDGITFTILVAISGLSFTPASIGFQFYSGNTAGNYTQHQVAIDFLRFTIGSIQSPYGIP